MRIIKKSRNGKNNKSSVKGFKSINPTLVGEIVPRIKIIVTLDCENTNFLVTFKNASIVQCTALDGTFETINIPVSQFNKQIYTFEYTDKNGKKDTYVSKLNIYCEGV